MIVLNKPIIFVGGLIIGAAGGVLSTMAYFKNKYNKIADQQIREMEEYYHNRDTYARPSGDDLAEDDAEINPVNEDRSAGPLSQEAREQIKEKLMRNHEITTNYAKVYEEKHPDLYNEPTGGYSEIKRGADEEAEEEKDLIDEVNEEHQKHKFDPPRIITEEEYSALPPHIDTQVLYFYHDDETLVDDEDDVIEDPAVLIGSALNDSGFIDSDDTMLFVYHPGLDTAYEIQRVDGAWYGNE